jgi:DNA (cytosine-5)-methyltransferase 1
MKVIDLFSGCGGLSLGFMNAGYEILAAFDNWKPAINVYNLNFNHPIIEKDLSKFSDKDIKEFSNYNPDMIVGGPPCQDFSSAGKRDETLGRADLTIEFANIVTQIKPKWFVMENVDRAIKSQAYKKAYEILEKNYGLTRMILDASYCGVPQSRKRMFLIGELGGKPHMLEPYLLKNMSAFPMTVRDYFGNELKIDHYYRHPRSYQRRGVFSVDEPSPTIRGVNRPIPPKYNFHAGDTTTLEKTPSLRPLTTHERSQVQTFPKDFNWGGMSKAHTEQMIGNAVPVKLAEYVAMCIKEYIWDSLNGTIIKSESLKLMQPVLFS